MKEIILIVPLVLVSACRPSPFQLKPLSLKTTKIEATYQKASEELDEALKEGLKTRYQKAQRPVFALINGWYRLPSSSPVGRATVVKSFSYRTYFEEVLIDHPKQDYVISPISGDQALALNQGLNQLLDLGVNIKEIAMADAMALAKAEEKAALILPPQVDYLVSLNKSQSERGMVLVGRVIGKDGRLMAFRVIYQASDTNISGLLLSLFEDTLSRS